MIETSAYASHAESVTKRRILHRLVGPAILFPSLALTALAAIWLVTFTLAEREQWVAERRAAQLAVDMAETYEAQIVRALREIDITLKLVRYSLDGHSPQEVLDDLNQQNMLPSALLFEVLISDVEGNVLASTNGTPAEQNLAPAPEDEGLVIDFNHQTPSEEESRLAFSRRIIGNDQDESKWVTVLVNAAYFVSGYEPDTLGKKGVLALVGADGTFLVRRTGETIRSGERVDYDALLQENSTLDEPARVRPSEWDGMPRYTVARPLFEFPVAIVLGLAEAEHVAAANARQRTYHWRASLISLIALSVLLLLGRLSWKLRKTQARAYKERLIHAQRAEYLAFHDSLTGLPNRALFSQLLTKETQKARRYDRSLVLLFLDLDRFKAINDSLGHDAGDKLLQEVGRRLCSSVRESDTVARLGGDEFVVLLPEMAEPHQISQVTNKILTAVSAPFTLVGQEFRITVSIGVAQYPTDGDDEQTLMKHADVAMYHAKEEGKNNAQLYSEQMKSDSLERLALEPSLRKALERQEFVL